MKSSPLKAAKLDVIELLRPLPDPQIPTGSQGTIVETYPNDRYLVEFANDNGETIALHDLDRSDFTIVWQADTQRPIPIEERFLDVITQLPEERQQAAWEFTRSLMN